MEPDTIAVAIRKARIYAGLTQKQVADALEKSQTTVAAWESGRSQPDAKTIVQLAELFQVSCDFLLGVSDFHDKNSEVFLKALLGEDSDLLTCSVRDSLAQFTNDVSRLCNLLQKIDIELLPYAIKALAAVLHVLEDLSDIYDKYVRMLAVNGTAANLLTEFQALSEEEQKEALSSYELLDELLKECVSLNEMMRGYSPNEFAGEALQRIDQARDSMAVFALHLSAKLESIGQCPKEIQQD